MLGNPRSYEEACRTFRWRIPDRYNLAFDVCDRQSMEGADGHRTALVVELNDGSVARYTFQVLRLLANRLANVLSALGVTAGDRVAVALDAGVEAAVALLAITRMGAVMVPIPTAFGVEPLAWRLSDSGATVAILAPSVLPAWEEVRKGLDDPPRILCPQGGGPGVGEMWSLVEKASDSFAPLVTPAGHPAFLFYPGHGWGRPAAAILPHRAMAGGLPAVEMALGLFPQFGDVAWTSQDWMGAEALFRCVLPAWHHGVAVVAGPDRLDPERSLDLMGRHGVRAVVAPLHHLSDLAEAALGRPRPQLRALASGPDPLHEALHERVLRAFGIHANEAWGTVESGAVTANLAGMMELRPPSPGRAAPGLAVEAVDERGRVLKVGERGILAVSPNAPGSFLGYWGENTGGPARRVAGWLLTGRMGRRDLDGYLWPEPVPVPDGIIRVNGLPVCLDEVEATLSRHPQVAEAGVVEQPSGQLRAFVVPAPGAPEGLEMALRPWLERRRCPWEVPRRMEIIQDIPRLVDGSVDRETLAFQAPRLDGPKPEDRWLSRSG